MSITWNNIKEAPFVAPTFWVTVPQGTKVADLLDPAFWTHVAARLKPNMRLEVVPEDYEYYVELFVLAADTNRASVKMLRQIQLETSVLPQVESTFEIKFRGANYKWSVVSRSDKKVIKDEFQEKTAAQQWLTDYEAQLAVA
jgi:hypothetical protein